MPTPPPSTASTTARAALGAALRQLSHDVVGHQPDDALLDEMTSALVAFSARITASPARSREKQAFHEHWETHIDEGDPITSFEYRPFSGAASPGAWNRTSAAGATACAPRSPSAPRTRVRPSGATAA